jgi:hypothetical protein
MTSDVVGLDRPVSSRRSPLVSVPRSSRSARVALWFIARRSLEEPASCVIHPSIPRALGKLVDYCGSPVAGQDPFREDLVGYAVPRGSGSPASSSASASSTRS